MQIPTDTAPLFVPTGFVSVRRQPGYITIAGETFEDETDYDIPDGRAADRPSLTADVYETPDPAFVLKIARMMGFHAACERWSMRSRGTITQWICDGRRLEGTLKTVEDEERDRIVAVTAELSSVIRAARALEIPESRVYAAHKQAGVTPPTLSKAEKSAATKAGLEAKGLGRGMSRGPRGAAVPVNVTCH
jgi:hypothetical protein